MATPTSTATGQTNATLTNLNAMTLNLPYVLAELVIAVASTMGNVLVCVAVLRDHRLRTVTNYFLVSLAVADFCVGALAVPCAILTDLGIPRHNFHLCVLMLCVLIMLTQSSIFSLLAMAIERYAAIFRPLRYQSIVTPRNAGANIAITWLLSLLIGLVPLMGWHQLPPADGHCFFVTVMDMTYMVYFNFFGCVLGPLAAMFAIYTHILAEVRRLVTRRAGEGRRDGAQAAGARREMKTASSLFLVLALFAICWLPLHVINCVLLLCPQCPVPLPLLLAATILSHANSAVNPILYAFKMKAFRRAFKAIFLCHPSQVGPAMRVE
ncbi:adenosine A2c receptor [Cetorhinus maximus]